MTGIKITSYRLVAVPRAAKRNYTRSKIRKALPKEFAYVLEELLTERGDLQDKESYYDAIVQTIVRVGRAKAFIIALSELIQRLTVDHLHIVGDIYDRVPGPHIIMDKMMTYHSIDVQWGNHDVLWMGAAGRTDGLYCKRNPYLREIWETWIFWRMVTASTFFHWQPLRSIHMGMTRAPASS